MTGTEANRDDSRSVIHVLPHPGGGGETYVDALAQIEGYRADRVYLSPGTRPARAVIPIARTVLGLHRAIGAHTLLHVHGEVASAVCLPGLARRASVVTLHGLHLVRRLDGARRIGAKANLALVVRLASRTICVSEAERDDLVALVGDRAVRRTVVIHNGVDAPEAPNPAHRVTVRAEFEIPPASVVGVMVGGLDEHKDPLTAVRAATMAARNGADLRLIVAGDGPLREKVEDACHDAGGVVIVAGYRDDVSRLLSAADFFVLPSRREGLSFALLEAMSLGLPPVVSDAPGNPEAVGETGIVVACGGVAGFAAAFSLLSGDADERSTRGVRARERVERHFRAEDMLAATREVYDGVVQEHRGA